MRCRAKLDLESLLSRAEEVGDCLEWQGSYGSQGVPIVSLKNVHLQARRAVYQAICCGPLPITSKNPITTTCDNKRCVKPEHLKRSTTKKVAIKAGKAGKFSTLSRSLAISRGNREAGRCKLSPEQVAEIRVSEGTNKAVAQIYGVNASLIGRIKNGKCHPQPFSVWSQLIREAA